MLRRLDCVLEPTKAKVLDEAARLVGNGKAGLGVSFDLPKGGTAASALRWGGPQE